MRFRPSTGTYYVYNRPAEGQIEDRLWAKLTDAQRRVRSEAIQDGIHARRDAWNACHPPERQIPRQEPTV